MSLPIEWVEKIFAKLSVTYGRAFISQYEGIDPQAIKEDWAHELSAYHAKPEAIKFALQTNWQDDHLWLQKSAQHHCLAKNPKSTSEVLGIMQMEHKFYL